MRCANSASTSLSWRTAAFRCVRSSSIVVVICSSSASARRRNVALVRECGTGLFGFTDLRAERDLGAPGSVLRTGQAALGLALDLGVVGRVFDLLLLLAQLLEPFLPALGPGEPEPTGLADLLLAELRRHPAAEVPVLVDDPPGDVECGRRETGEVEVAAERRGRRLSRVGRLTRARHLHGRFERRAQQRVRRRRHRRACCHPVPLTPARLP